MAELMTPDGWSEPDSFGVYLRDILPDDYFVIDNPSAEEEGLQTIVYGPSGLFVLHTRDWSGQILPVATGDWQVSLGDNRNARYPNPDSEVKRSTSALNAFLQEHFPDFKPDIHHLLVLTDPAATLMPAPQVQPLAVTRNLAPMAIMNMHNPDNGQVMDYALAREFASALAQRRLASSKRTPEPFVFRSNGFFGGGKQVWTIKDAVKYMDSHPEAGIYHLRNGTFADWLQRQGAEDLASLAREVMRQGTTDSRAQLEDFLIGSDLVARPKLKVHPTPINFGSVTAGERGMCTAHVRKGRGRGYLYGEVYTSEPWIHVEPQHFAGDATALTLQVDTARLPISTQAWRGDLLVECNASPDPIAIPVRVQVMGMPAKKNRYFVRPLISLLLMGAIGAGLGLLLASASFPLPGWLQETTGDRFDPHLFWAVLFGFVWAILGVFTALRQRSAWPIVYANGRYLLRILVWALALAAVAVALVLLWNWRSATLSIPLLPAIVFALALSIFPATLSEIRQARNPYDTPLGAHRHLLARPLLWMGTVIVLLTLLTIASAFVSPAVRSFAQGDTFSDIETWAASGWNQLDNTVAEFVEDLMMRRYDDRLPPSTPIPTTQPGNL